jgi:hypothetical protein
MLCRLGSRSPLTGVCGTPSDLSGTLLGTGGVGFFHGFESVLEKVDFAFDKRSWKRREKSDRMPPIIGIGSEIIGRPDEVECRREPDGDFF